MALFLFKSLPVILRSGKNQEQIQEQKQQNPVPSEKSENHMERSDGRKTAAMKSEAGLIRIFSFLI